MDSPTYSSSCCQQTDLSHTPLRPANSKQTQTRIIPLETWPSIKQKLHQKLTKNHLFSRLFWSNWTNKRQYKRSRLPFDHHKAGSRMIQTTLSLCAHPAWVLFSSPWTANSKRYNITFVLYLGRTIQISRQKWKHHCWKSQTYPHAIKATLLYQ